MGILHRYAESHADRKCSSRGSFVADGSHRHGACEKGPISEPARGLVHPEIRRSSSHRERVLSDSFPAFAVKCLNVLDMPRRQRGANVDDAGAAGDDGDTMTSRKADARLREVSKGVLQRLQNEPNHGDCKFNRNYGGGGRLEHHHNHHRPEASSILAPGLQSCWCISAMQSSAVSARSCFASGYGPWGSCTTLLVGCGPWTSLLLSAAGSIEASPDPQGLVLISWG